MGILNGKIALITGAGSGIGFEIARQFHLEGATILLNDLDKNLCLKAAQLIDKNLTNCFPFPGDAGDVEFIERTFREIEERFDHLDIVIANAGYSFFRDFLSITPAELREVIRINIEGTFFLIQHAAKKMIKHQTKGRIIVTSSVVGRRAHIDLSAYGMTKGALETLTRNLVIELSEHGITINAIAPGATITERTMEDREYQSKWSKLTPLGEPATTNDIANTAKFLASDEASHITGQTIVVDGGWTCISPGPDYIKD